MPAWTATATTSTPVLAMRMGPTMVAVRSRLRGAEGRRSLFRPRLEYSVQSLRIDLSSGAIEEKGSGPSVKQHHTSICGRKSRQQDLCGDVQLAGNVTLTGSNVIVIRNGKLDMNGKSITTASGASATIIFAGGAAAQEVYSHFPTGGGTINVSSPTSGTVVGRRNLPGSQPDERGRYQRLRQQSVLEHQRPCLSPSFVGYVQRRRRESDDRIGCFALVVDNITINGTASMLSGTVRSARTSRCRRRSVIRSWSPRA